MVHKSRSPDCHRRVNNLAGLPVHRRFGIVARRSMPASSQSFRPPSPGKSRTSDTPPIRSPCCDRPAAGTPRPLHASTRKEYACCRPKNSRKSSALAGRHHVLVRAVGIHDKDLVALELVARRLKNDLLAVGRPICFGVFTARGELPDVREMGRRLRKQTACHQNE